MRTTPPIDQSQKKVFREGEFKNREGEPRKRWVRNHRRHIPKMDQNGGIPERIESEKMGTTKKDQKGELESTKGNSQTESTKGRIHQKGKGRGFWPGTFHCSQGSRPYGYRPALTGAYPEVEIAVDGRAESGGKVLRSLCLNRNCTLPANHTLMHIHVPLCVIVLPWHFRGL